MKALLWKLIGIIGLLTLVSSCAEDTLVSPELHTEPTQVQQHDHRTCLHTAHMEDLLSDPAFKAAYDKRMEKHAIYVDNVVSTRSACSSPTVLPVAVHFQGASSNDLACLTALAQESVAALNADFQGNNSDLSSWTGQAAASFPAISHGEACLQFVLALSLIHI